MKIYSFILLLFSQSIIVAQEGAMIDSLKQELSKQREDTTIIDVLNALSNTYSPIDFDSAKFYAENAVGLSQKIQDRNREAWSLNKIGNAYDYNGSIDTALIWYNKSLSIFYSIKDSSRIADLYLNIGVCYHYGTLYDSALAYYVRAAELKEKIGTKKHLQYAFNNIGMILRTQGAYKKAVEYYRKSLNLKRSINDKKGIIKTLGNMASAFQSMEEYDTAELYIMEGLNLALQIADSSLIAWSYLNIGQNSFNQNQFNNALEYQLKAKALIPNHGEKRDLLLNYLGLAQTYYELKNFDSSKKHYMEAKQMAINLGMMESLANVYKGLSALYKDANLYRESLLYYLKFDSLSDEMFNESKASIVEKLEQKYQSELKENAIAKLEIEKQKSENLRNVFILLASIVILVSGLLYVLLRSKSKANKFISKSLAEKETLLREIHHRVKNNLQVISSLLSLQSRYMDDEKAQAAVNEGQNRVKSMALIHQKLYQQDNLMGVEALDYIQNLTSALKASYGIDSEKVEVKYDIDDLNIDVDTIIPIGLILNELISNSFKHAFPKERTGELSIYFKEVNNHLELKVKDDGVGTTADTEKPDSFGIRMINSLAMKLEAEVNFDFSNGSEATLAISSYKLV